MTDVTSHDGLAPDEKLCPYCAETIKAAAVKCRFCHSDLSAAPAPATAPDDSARPAPEATPAPVSLDKPAPELVGNPQNDPQNDPENDPENDPGDDRDPEPFLALPGSGRLQGSRGSTRLVAALVVLCLVLGGALWFVVHRARHPHLDTAPNGQVTQSSFRNAAMSAASDAAGKILSYSWQSFDADRKAGRALVTGEAAKEYDKAMDEVASKVAATKLTLKANVLSVGTISVEEHRAKVLVFVDTVTTRDGAKGQQLQQSRLVMDLIRKDGDWTVSKMDAF